MNKYDAYPVKVNGHQTLYLHKRKLNQNVVILCLIVSGRYRLKPWWPGYGALKDDGTWSGLVGQVIQGVICNLCTPHLL